MLHRTLICLLLVALAGCSEPEKSSAALRVDETLADAQFIGQEDCAGCHADQHASWLGSHHERAMDIAAPDTVRGDFDNASFEHFGTTSRFYRRDDAFFVETDNEHGAIQEYRIAYTFGVEPLQQYLIEFPKGRLQTLPLAWDVEKAAWFHMYPDQAIVYDDELHWTGRQQNWNYMCAECHSTNLRKNYEVTTDTFDTTWSEINVSCEACHGPGSNHIMLAREGRLTEGTGLQVSMDDRAGVQWEMNPETGIAERRPPLMSPPAEPEACGRCHARRGIVAADYEYGMRLLDTHTVSLLDELLYFADGQIDDEVYVYGSFLQSRMYQAGVTCSDCHDPHTARLRTSGEVSNICSTCHLPQKFASAEHHKHAADAVQCVDCHMASRDYMVVDGRRDHSFRIPRPDLTLATAAPNACNACHEEEGALWAATAWRDWYGDPGDHFALAIHDAREGRSGANRQLLAVAEDTSVSGIVRATALTLLRAPLMRDEAELIQRELRNPDPLIRIGALRALMTLPGDIQAQWGVELLGDPVRAVRVAAVDVISPLRTALPAAYEARFKEAEREYIDSQLAIVERPEAITNLANLSRERNDFEQARTYFLHALRMQPGLTTARSNLADLYRQLGRDGEGEKVLREGIAINPDDAALRHSLGLLLVRAQQADAALDELRRAAELQPGNPRFVYVYGVALNSLGRAEEAIAVLTEAGDRFPADLDIAVAHVSFLHEAGRREEAIRAANQMQLRFPANPNVQALLRDLFVGDQ